MALGNGYCCQSGYFHLNPYRFYLVRASALLYIATAPWSPTNELPSFQPKKNFARLRYIKHTFLFTVFPFINIYLRWIEIAQIELFTIFSRYFTRQGHFHIWLFDSVFHNARTTQMSAMRQHTQRDIPEPFPIVQKIRQDVISNFINIFSMNVADHIQVWRINNNFTTQFNCGFEFIHRLRSCP